VGAFAHPESRNMQQAPRPKPEKQPKTQKAYAESRNFRQNKRRNKKNFKHKQRKNAKSHNIPINNKVIKKEKLD